MKINVDERQAAILSHIAVGDRVADIGCDHGKIALLAAEKSGYRTIATDRSAKSLKKAKTLAEELGASSMLDFRVGDGLSVICDGEIDTAVIAGMGGFEIIDILMASSLLLKKYILVPHQNPSELRRYLLNNGYGVTDDYTVRCGKRFYQIIVASKTDPSHPEYGEFELLYGVRRDETLKLFVENELKKLKVIAALAKGDRLKETEREISLLEAYES